MNIYHIFHHNDDDGIAAAAVIYEYLKVVNKDNKKHIKCLFHKIDYTTELDSIVPNNIPTKDEIYFVDYSFSRRSNLDYMINLANNGNKIVWIDHHKTSLDVIYGIKMAKGFNISEYENINHFIDTTMCGAYLAYLYAYLNLNNNYNSDSQINMLNIPDNIPLFIKYIDSWDTWKHNMPNTTEFHYGINTLKWAPSNLFSNIFKFNSDNLNKLFSSNEEDVRIVDSCMKKFIKSMTDRGSVIKEYRDVENNIFCNEYGFKFTIIDEEDKIVYDCFALNKKDNSMAFGDKINDYDIVVLFYYTGKQYVYSLYTIKDIVNCEKIAKKLGTIDGLGGGGHTKAAGFQTYNPIIKYNSVIHIQGKKLFNKNKYKIYII